MLWRDLRAWQIYGANTDVGKTILSTVLCRALARRAPSNGLLYLKPVSTGPQDEADDRHIKKFTSGIVSQCISQFAEPVSPHLAAQNFTSSRKVIQDDSGILSKVKQVLLNHAESGGRYALLETAGGVLSPGPSGTVQADLYRPLRLPVLLVGDSKLGGIGTTISVFESLHLRGYDVESVLLFDDPKWGNQQYLQKHFAKHDIESFALPLPPARQSDVQEDTAALENYYDKCAASPVIDQLISLLHQKHFTKTTKLTSMPAYADSVIWHPFRQHQLPQNVIAIDSAYGDHFTTYNALSDASLHDPEVNSPSGLAPLQRSTSQPPITTPLYDASASWWTQGLGHGNPDLSLTAAYAAGRYGHVMFASAVHEPALDLSLKLLSILQNPRLSRVFFTDNGSTGMEVAVKMALRATCQRYGWNKNDIDQPVGVIGLKGSYHGDTIGVMNASEPSTFNEKVDWYRPWGHWFEAPEVRMRQGKWLIEVPAKMQTTNVQQKPLQLSFDHLSQILDFASRSKDAEMYEEHIANTLTRLTQDEKRRFGALILEPLIMGAGGMVFVDPLFQRTLVTAIRNNPRLIAPDFNHDGNKPNMSGLDPDWSGVPFIADEVFTGLYRLGRASSCSFLNTSASKPASPAATFGSASASGSPQHRLETGIAPDISVHAKLLTGGLLPLALTTASEAIFRTFLSDSKADALLHGHSYTAHPVGCAVANKSLDVMSKLARADQAGSSSKSEDGWQHYRQAWASPGPSDFRDTTSSDTFSFWSPSFLAELSHHESVSSCFALGTVLALTIRPKPSSTRDSGKPMVDSGAEAEADADAQVAGGYSSNAAASLQTRLLTTLDDQGCGIHSRVLGDVIYFMTSLVTKPDAVQRLQGLLLTALDDD